ncbi:MAG: fumarylacetoacetate hydrolase family protein [Anaerolineae bacterium]|nr:fumarylacetoacetate hydrolase family protein [Anaerolineae bacterium]
MKLARIAHKNDALWCILDGEDAYALIGDRWRDAQRGERIGALTQGRLLAPVEPHNKVIGLGLTYQRMWRSYQRHTGVPDRDGPAVFMKPPNTVIADGEAIVQHAVCTGLIYEAELGVIIGRQASRVSADDALDHVGGYTCVNDVTASGFRNVEYPIVSTRFKICDTFCPIGPVVETELDPCDATVICRVNGREVQHSNTGEDLCFTVAEMIAWVSSFMTLNPGDILCTGSNGTGPIRPGDLVEVEIPGIGVLSNPVVAPH